MALANVAVELAQRGRRVLAVDFDLEAPGLDSFDLPKPEGIIPGIVDFVTEYLATGKTPAVREFVFESEGVGRDGGGLWIMPSGAHPDTYASALASINWRQLYEQHDGYLMFEDLKEQWRDHLQPDYVLIDSRTGHTDVGGICTRQLPDSVAIIFFPNSQNLRGLAKVVRDIRSEAMVPGNNEIFLHFVMSNVPDLDDEEEILKSTVSVFEKELDFHDPMIIHRYESFLLLNEIIFTKDRPNSRLAKEYQCISEEIMKSNLKDRHGALSYLEDMVSPTPAQHFRSSEVSESGWPPRNVPSPELQRVRKREVRRVRSSRGISPLYRLRSQQKLQETSSQGNIDADLVAIEQSHSDDGEVLFRLGCYRSWEEIPEDAIELFNRSIKAGYKESEVYLRLTQSWQQDLENPENARANAAIVLNSPTSKLSEVILALSIIGSENFEKIDDLTGLYSRTPVDLLFIAQHLSASRTQAKIVVEMLLSLLQRTGLSTNESAEIRHSLARFSISVGNYSAAIDALERLDSERQSLTFEGAFNYAIALWGQTGNVVREAFERVLDLSHDVLDSHLVMSIPAASEFQCMAIVHWALGDMQEARAFAEEAIREMRSQGGNAFSSWQYLVVPIGVFERDIDELLKLIGGDENVKPRFLSVSD